MTQTARSALGRVDDVLSACDAPLRMESAMRQ
jgi:hypothetical protein